MKKALLVIDAQEDFIGEQRNKMKFNYEDIDELIRSINEKIENYDKMKCKVIYIANILPKSFLNKKFYPYGLVGSKGAKIDKRIKIVSEYYFEKQVGNAFKNKNLIKFIKDNEISDVDLVGVDGINCIYKTAKSAKKMGLNVTIINNCIGTINTEKYIKICEKLNARGVNFI